MEFSFTLTFVHLFAWGIYQISPLVLALVLVITLLGLIVGRLESWSRFDALYWAFITALTVGYGDIRPMRKKSKTLSVIIAWIGIMLTGIVVSITIKSASVAFENHLDPDTKKVMEQKTDKSASAVSQDPVEQA